MHTRGTCRGHATRELSGNDATPSAGTVAFLGKNDKCPRSWKLLGESCYKYISIAATWQNAEVECETMGAGLVEIDSQAENSFVFTMVTAAGAGQAWMGLSDVGTEGLFLLPSGQPPTFTKWQPGQPSDGAGKEDCATFWPDFADRWNDVRCDIDRPFVCEQVLF
ncbi:hypothetical protein V1264_024172 [Littorina saxatilis]|uniref:C-type lectin domain-containing protein n=2 Tax=Littorina saxatilis TaxID=31220 RepID=A0AAN9AMT7_9CAEN